MITVLGIDGSVSCTGLSLFNYDVNSLTYNYLGSDHIKNPKKTSDKYFENTSRIFNKFISHSFLQQPIDVVVIENYAFNGAAVTQLAELNGLIKNYCVSKEWEMKLVAPNTVKRLIGKHGHADKKVVQHNLNDYSFFSNKIWKSTDESDACAISLAYIKMELDPSLKPAAKPKKVKPSAGQ